MLYLGLQPHFQLFDILPGLGRMIVDELWDDTPTPISRGLSSSTGRLGLFRILVCNGSIYLVYFHQETSRTLFTKLSTALYCPGLLWNRRVSWNYIQLLLVTLLQILWIHPKTAPFSKHSQSISYPKLSVYRIPPIKVEASATYGLSFPLSLSSVSSDQPCNSGGYLQHDFLNLQDGCKRICRIRCWDKARLSSADGSSTAEMKSGIAQARQVRHR